MEISPSLIVSLLGLVAVGLPIALGVDPHSSSVASRLVFLFAPGCAVVALVLAILELTKGRSTRDWARVAGRLMLPFALIICISVLFG